MTTSPSCGAAVESEVLISSDPDADSSDDGDPLGYLDNRPPSDDEDDSTTDDDDDDDDVGSDYLEPLDDASPPDEGASACVASTSAPEEQSSSAKPPVAKRKKAPTCATARQAKHKRKKASERRNIRKILKGAQLDASTLAAQHDELERKRRLQERLRDGLPCPATSDVPSEAPLERLLEDAEQQAASLQSRAVTIVKQPSTEVVEVIDSDEDECIIVHDTEQEADNQDPENSGSHVNDSLNVPDHLGRVLVNVNHPSADPDIFLSSRLARAVKPHQVGGIRFLYDNVIESMARFNNSPGFGCILAHSMGLGKTIQVISFVDVFIRHTKATRVLIIVPINTLQNWVAEFDMWLPLLPSDSCDNTTANSTLSGGFRQFNVYVVNEAHKTISDRAAILDKWTKDGGVLLLGYEMYRRLSTKVARAGRRRKVAPSEVIDLDEEDRNKELQIDMQNALVDPGPDLVICDEGHRIKNSHAGISQALKNLKTRRRIVLTGYPLQNNLTEYWCMVDFVRPNFLGTKVEFSNMFDRPITNGQCADSTPSDVTLMRYRAHVLHSLLEGFVQRRNHKVLQLALPPKEEWVLMLRMSPMQRALYKAYMDYLQQEVAALAASMNPIKAFSVCCKIWNHPDVLAKFLRSKKTDDDLDLDVARGEACRSTATNGARGKVLKKNASHAELGDAAGGQNDDSAWTSSDKKEQEINYDWATSLMTNYVPSILENSGKMVFLFEIIDRTVELGEKLLVFSQSLFTLDLIEEYLTGRPLPLLPCHDGSNYPEFWTRNKTYFRLDGSTPAMERERLVNQFNEPGNRSSLFLLSTRAGCLGINLTGASRVIIMDASWNPCHDCQAVCRIYRYGQERSCFIYRLVADNTLEKKIYERQVNKQGMADRVVDELQPQNRFGKKDSDQLLAYEDRDLPFIDTSNVDQHCNDPVLVCALKSHGHWISQDPFKHESLLVDKVEYRLSRAEKRFAKESYEKEKRLCVSFSRPSYANYYQQPTHQQPTTSSGSGGFNFSLPFGHPSRSFASNLHDYGGRSGIFPGSSSAGNLPPPVYPTPVPRVTAFSHGSTGADLSRLGAVGPTVVRDGVTVQQVTVNRDIVVNESSDGEPRCIRAGDQVMIIRTPKGMYLRTQDGKIFAVRSHRNDTGNGAVADSLHQMLQEQQHMQSQRQQSSKNSFYEHRFDGSRINNSSNTELQSNTHGSTSGASSSLDHSANLSSRYETVPWTTDDLPQFDVGQSDRSSGGRSQFLHDVPNYQSSAVNRPLDQRTSFYSVPVPSTHPHNAGFYGRSGLQLQSQNAAHGRESNDLLFSMNGADSRLPHTWNPNALSSLPHSTGYSTLDSTPFIRPQTASTPFATTTASATAAAAGSSNISSHRMQVTGAFSQYASPPYGTTFLGYGGPLAQTQRSSAASHSAPTQAIGLPPVFPVPRGSDGVRGSDEDDDDVAVVAAQPPP